MALNIIIVEKTGVLKSLAIKEFKEDELFKKCGFKIQVFSVTLAR